MHLLYIPWNNPGVEPPPMKKCPICHKSAEPSFKPFCSKRCREVDLYHWLKGSYSIPVVENDDAPEEESGEETSGDQ